MVIRDDFKIIKNGLVYFDSAATMLKPQIVIDKITDYYTNYSVNINRGDYDLAMKTNIEYEEVRSKVKSFINAKNNNEIVFTSGTTMAINMICNGYFKHTLMPEDEIIISNSEHASNILPWFNLSLSNKAVIRYCPLNDKLGISLEAVKKTITPKTKVIAFAHVTNVIGDIRPLKEIITYAHQLGIIVVVDAAQSIAHLKVDVQDLDCDFLAFSGHKMMGPTGIGVLYGKFELLNKIKPLILGGGMNESFDDENQVILKELPEKLEAGTQNISGVIGLGSAIDYIEGIGIDKIQNYEQDLNKYLISKLLIIPHIKLVNEHSETGIITFNVDGIFCQDVSIYLNKYRVCVRAGNHCAKILKKESGIANSVRISLAIYNTKEEIDFVVDLLSDKNKILKEMI